MVLIDADIVVIDQRYLRDAKYATNQRFLLSARTRNIPFGMTTEALLEAVGILSFGTPTNQITGIRQSLIIHYQLDVIPDPAISPEYSRCTIFEIEMQMVAQMALGDAVQAVQIAKYAPPDSALITWNAKHFLGKLPIPVMTPAEWLAANP